MRYIAYSVEGGILQRIRGLSTLGAAKVIARIVAKTAKEDWDVGVWDLDEDAKCFDAMKEKEAD